MVLTGYLIAHFQTGNNNNTTTISIVKNFKTPITSMVISIQTSWLENRHFLNRVVKTDNIKFSISVDTREFTEFHVMVSFDF